MNLSNNAFDKIVTVLSRSYRAREPMDIGESWQDEVMHHIRKLEPLHTGKAVIAFSDYFMWRFVPAACILIVIMTFVLSKGAFNPEYEMTKFFFSDPIQYTATQLWGV
jgi:hypothetical protein